MSSRKEEERNEKIIRGLLKLPPNRRCINCNSLGPQYVCTNFWTFVCITCSGIHREFTHRVKSVSMSKFTTQEVEALQRGGNQRAREQFLNDWDFQGMRLPSNSNPDRIREFIKNVYVDKKYAGSRSSEKPPRDTQNHKGEEDHRRASSYHSFSQSPPYDYQYEERRYGRQAGVLTRKPGSDRGHREGKISSFLYSPGRHAEQMCEDRFANESSGSRMSDYSVSSVPFRCDGQSPSFHDPGYGSPPSQVRDILVQDTQPQKLEANVKGDINRIPRAHRSASSGSFGSFDSNSFSIKSANSGSLIDSVLEPERDAGVQQADVSTSLPSPPLPSSKSTQKIDLFSQEFVQVQRSLSASSVDLFSHINNQTSTKSSERKSPAAAHLSSNGGWATFDLQHHTEVPFKVLQDVPPGGKDFRAENVDLFSSMNNNSDWFSFESSISDGHSSFLSNRLPMGSYAAKGSADLSNPQLWNAFHDPVGNAPQTSSSIVPQNSELQDMSSGAPPTDLFAAFKAPELNLCDGFLDPAVDDKNLAAAPITGIAGSLFPPPTTPQTGGITQDHKAANPFDLPYDTDLEASNMFLDMNPLQAALPDTQPATFIGGLPDPWFPQNSLTSFSPPVSQGGLAYIGGQVSSAQLQNIPSQGPVASLGGNPFA